MSDKKNKDNNELMLDQLSAANTIFKEKIGEFDKKDVDSSLLTILFELFASLYFDKEESAKYWNSVVAHRENMRERLKRDVGIRVAILDYFSNIENRFKNPKIVEMELFEQILKASKEDPKTGIYNSKYFLEVLENEINKAKRNDFSLSLLFLDIDGFKEYNNKLGHVAGDRLLIHISEILNQLVRGEDVAARFGGDEFVVMLTYTEKNGAAIVADRIIKEIQKQPLSFDGKNKEHYYGGISIGIASYPLDANSREELMDKADKALYEAKKSGKNKIRCYKEKGKKADLTKTKRRIVRYEIEGKDIYLNLKDSDDKYRACLKNISEEGLLMEIPYIIPLLSGIKLEVEIKNSKLKTFCLSGEILYVKKQNSGYLAAIKYDESIKNKALLKEYLDVQKKKIKKH
ncbi:diguanylate cyclase [bacterium]|nr:diguanylate cyclase [bacterium]